MLNIHKQAFNTILLVLILILIIMTLNCIPFNETIEGNRNMNLRAEYSNQDIIDAESAVQGGTEEYMQGIQNVASLNNKLIRARQNLSDANINTIQEVETLKSHDIIGAKVFTLAKAMDDTRGTPEHNDLYYMGTSNKLYNLSIDHGDTRYGSPLNVNADALSNKTPILLEHLSDMFGGFFLCITSDFKKYKLTSGTLNQTISLNSKWVPFDFEGDMIKYVMDNENRYYIDNNQRLYYFRTNELAFGIPGVKNIDLSLDIKSHKLYTLSEHNNLGQAIYVYDLNSDNGSYNQDEVEVQATYSIFYFGELQENFTHMKIYIGNSFMNDDNNKVYLIGHKDGKYALYSVSLKYDNTHNNVYNLSTPNKIVDIPAGPDINGLQINLVKSEIYIYAEGMYYTYPLQGPNMSLIQDTYKTINKSAIDTANSEIDGLKRNMINTQDTIDTLNSNFNDNEPSLMEKSLELQGINDTLNSVINEKNALDGNIQEQSAQINMVVIRYIFWIVTSIITIILLGLNYFAPDIISAEMIIVFAGLMMVAVYLNRSYFGKYIDPVFSKLKTGFSSAISPLYSN